MKVYVVKSLADFCVYGYQVYKNQEDAEKQAQEANKEWGVLDYFVDEYELVG